MTVSTKRFKLSAEASKPARQLLFTYFFPPSLVITRTRFMFQPWGPPFYTAPPRLASYTDVTCTLQLHRLGHGNKIHGFSDIWELLEHAGGRAVFFYYWHAVLVNIINCIKCTNTVFTRETVQSCTNPHTGQYIRVH